MLDEKYKKHAPMPHDTLLDEIEYLQKCIKGLKAFNAELQARIEELEYVDVEELPESDD